MNKPLSFSAKALCAVAMAVAALGAQAAATKARLLIVNGDPAGVGFNDTTPAAPVGGNPGTTLGEQRLFVYDYVAKKWGRELPPGPPIRVAASWQALTCSATSAVLGSAGAYNVWRNFPNAPKQDVWYSSALANTLAGADLDEGVDPEIISRFNVNLGTPGCLPTSPFYLGVDNVAPAGHINFAVVLLHELGHGLGFQALTSGLTGARIADDVGTFPAMWESFMYDNTAGKSWADMTDAERVTSGINTNNLVWTGANVLADAPKVLNGTPFLKLFSKAAPDVAGTYPVGTASFGAPVTTTGLKGDVAPIVDQTDGVTGLACTALSPENAAAVAGKIALVDRGVCGFTIKAKNVQDAGAVGVLVADNVVAGLTGLGGTDPTVVIPAVRILKTDGAKIRAGVAAAGAAGVRGNLRVDNNVRSASDAAGRPRLYAPNPYQSGSSVSHWDTAASPNLLMEPAINPDLTQKVKAPADLTLPLLKDIGWPIGQ